MTSSVLSRAGRVARRPTPRHYVMCPPTFFDVVYAINPWMHPERPVDRDLAGEQWDRLVAAYRSAGHRVDLLTPLPGLPDMVFTANGATVVDGKVLGARFANEQRTAEAVAHGAWHRRHGVLYGGSEIREPVAVNEAEGDFAVLSGCVLAGHGFRTSRAAHAELASLTGLEVISLELVDPEFYHLDVALAVLDDGADHIAYYPDAFSPEARRVLRRRFPDAVIATRADAYAFALNVVSDGLHVFLQAGAPGLEDALAEAGYQPVPIDLGELIKAGGSVKCCTQEVRPARPHPRS